MCNLINNIRNLTTAKSLFIFQVVCRSSGYRGKSSKRIYVSIHQWIIATQKNSNNFIVAQMKLDLF